MPYKDWWSIAQEEMESSQESGVDEDTVFIKVGNRGRGRGGSGEGEGWEGEG